VKGHGLFKELDWDMVIKKQYKPPFEPFVYDDTDVQHFDEQFTSRSPRESNDTPPNHKNEDSNTSTKSKPVIDCTNVFEDFDYVADKFIEEAAATTNQRMDRQNQIVTRNANGSKYNGNDIETDPVDDSDDSSFTWKKCSKCQLQLDIKNNRSNSNSGDENKAVDELKELRICSHGS
jgi:hypothetical protein